LGFGAQQNPIDAPCLRWVRKGAQSNLNVPFRSLQHKTFDRLSDAGDDVMPIRRAQASRHDAPYASEADDGDGGTRFPG
jgi:hypothetical protein